MTQLLLTFILILSTAFLIGVGIQFFIALRDFRRTLVRVNTILDTVESASRELETGVSGVIRFFDGFKSLLKTLELINLLTPLHDYLKRKHGSKLPAETTPLITKHRVSLHSLMDKMKAATQKKDKRIPLQK